MTLSDRVDAGRESDDGKVTLQKMLRNPTDPIIYLTSRRAGLLASAKLLVYSEGNHAIYIQSSHRLRIRDFSV